MGRRSSSPTGIGVGAGEELRADVERLSGRLLMLAPPVPLTHDEVERLFSPRWVTDKMREVAGFAPRQLDSFGSVECVVGDAAPVKGTGGTAPFTWRVTFSATAHANYPKDKALLGFFRPDGVYPEDYRPPDDILQKTREWAKARWMVGFEAGLLRRYVEDFLEACRSPAQVKKLWPELLEFSGGQRVQAVKSKLSANECARARRPEDWDGGWEKGLRMAQHILSKCALLPASTGERPAIVGGVYRSELPQPKAAWGRNRDIGVI